MQLITNEKQKMLILKEFTYRLCRNMSKYNVREFARIHRPGAGRNRQKELVYKKCDYSKIHYEN
jgi:hypothetical protein